jgi:Tfp pilus assembly protein PilF
MKSLFVLAALCSVQPVRRAYASLNENDKSLSEALEAIREQPKMTLARVIAAHIYEDRGEHPKALEQTDVILASNSSNPDARLIRLRALVGLNEAGRALPKLEALLQQCPQMNDARNMLANLYLRQKQYLKASGEFEHMWSSNPRDSRGFLGLHIVKLARQR